jgi:ribosome-binding protein aMBF1 (putative translation factor)
MAKCNDCLYEATGSLVVNNYVVNVCKDCESIHQEVGSAANGTDKDEVKPDIRQPWETKIRSLYTMEVTVKHLTPNISACRKIDTVLLIKFLFIL